MQCGEVKASLLELIEEELPAAQRPELRTHLHGCATCAAEFAAYQDLLGLIQTDTVPEPPPGFWEEFLPSLQHRIEQEEVHRPKPASIGWLAGIGSLLTFRPRLIAGLAVAAASLFIVVRMPGLLSLRVDRPAAPMSTEQIVGRNGKDRSTGTALRHDNGNQHFVEPFVVGGEVVEEPALLMEAIARHRWIDEIADPLETAWLLRPEADLTDSLTSLDEKERQILLDHLNHLKWSES